MRLYISFSSVTDPAFVKDRQPSSPNMLITVGQKSSSPDSVASSKLRHLRTGLGNPKHRPPGQLDDPIYFGLVDCHSVGGATLRGSFPARLASVWVPESHQRSVRKPSIWSRAWRAFRSGSGAVWEPVAVNLADYSSAWGP